MTTPKNRCLKCYAPTPTAHDQCCETCRKIDSELAKLKASKEGKKK